MHSWPLSASAKPERWVVCHSGGLDFTAMTRFFFFSRLTTSPVTDTEVLSFKSASMDRRSSTGFVGKSSFLSLTPFKRSRFFFPVFTSPSRNHASATNGSSNDPCNTSAHTVSFFAMLLNWLLVDVGVASEAVCLSDTVDSQVCFFFHDGNYSCSEDIWKVEFFLWKFERFKVRVRVCSFSFHQI